MTEDERVHRGFQYKKIGLSLSGGGYRAAAFHLGVLSYLAENKLLENVTHISTVSGGSLVTGLIYKLNDYKWPSSEQYLSNVLDNAIHILQTTDLLEEQGLLAGIISWLTNGKYASHEVVVQKLKNLWEIDINLQGIADSPIWTINTTTGETGKSCRFQKTEMQDYKLGKIKNPSFDLAEILAASAGFPGIIGPLVVDLTQHDFIPNQGIQNTKISLYDGGLYDNLGTEVFFNGNFSKLPSHIDFLVVSDASMPFEMKKDMYLFGRKSKAKQILDISTEQIRSLRSRMFHRLVYRENEPDIGTYIRLGTTTLGLVEEAKSAKSVATGLKALSTHDMQCLIANGYDAASKGFSKYDEAVEDD